MAGLRVEAIETLVEWDRFDLLGFFQSVGFHRSREMHLVWDLNHYPFRGRLTPVRVRDATPDDLVELTAIDAEIFESARPNFFRAKLESAKKNGGTTLFLAAEFSGEVAGYLVADLFRGEFGIDEVRGVIESFGVREKFQHRGVASEMMESLLTWLRGRGGAHVETVCRWNQWPLLQFFEYIGFRPSSRICLEWRCAA